VTTLALAQASSHWYNSPLFGICGLVVGLAGVLVSLWLWKIGPSRRRLVYWIQADTPLVATRSPGLPDLPQVEVRLADRPDPLQDPHVISLRLENQTRPDIKPDDFTSGRPLVFDAGAPILEILNRAALEAEWPDLQINAVGSRLELQPTLLRGRERRRVDLLTDGPPNVTHDSRLADVRVRRLSSEPAGWEADRPQPPWIRQPALVIPVLLSLIAIAGAGFAYWEQRQAPGQPAASSVDVPTGHLPRFGPTEAIAYRLMPSYGLDPNTQYRCLGYLWEQASGWNPTATNSSGAYGIPQALPASKMASAGPDWRTDPKTQIKWGLGYIKFAYGSPCAAWIHEAESGWY
jgi:hypothetical protein